MLILFYTCAQEVQCTVVVPSAQGSFPTSMRDLAPHRELQRAYEAFKQASAEFVKVVIDGPAGRSDGGLLVSQVAAANAEALANYIEALKRYNDAIDENQEGGLPIY